VHDPAARPAETAAFAAAVHEAIARRGLSLRDLEAELVARYGPLASSVATLSAWQTGSSTPPRTAAGRDRVLALERCLGVPAGDLALLMPGGAVVPPARRAARAAGPTGRLARLEHLLTVLGGPQQTIPVTVAEDHRLGPDRRPRGVRVTLRVRAAHDGVDRHWLVRPEPRTRSTVVGIDGCRTGREVVEQGEPDLAVPPGRRLLATELLLDRVLRRGEHHEFSLLVHHADQEADRVGLRTAEAVVRHVRFQPYERLDLAVSFDPAALPVEVLRCRWRQRDLAEVARRRATRSGCRQYRLVVDDPAPGGYGWRWEWASALDRRASARGRRSSVSAA
jgi:hypothetical protein